ncbi:ABC transporter A family member 4 [Phytophthora cinnamomi]|uniref:ABC transporter A family member 4 n=1 Tax=Phytophthora cinnamomi TaxID=4785 RepID=UPI00355A07F8|nr:ABC transporter A family member 4 [Phytophthora cinnamomi]
MAGLWRSVRVLLWKNWRVKQRESRLNRGRSGRRWLYPALLTDIIVPLGLLLLLIQKLCEYNAQLVAPSGVDALDAFLERHKDAIMMEPERTRTLTDISGAVDATTAAGEEHDEQQLEVKVESGALLLAALPLMLAKSNQSLAVLQRRETEAFLQYLDRHYPPAEELGISSYAQKTKMVPIDTSLSNAEADQVLLEYPKKSGWNIYAGLDVRRTTTGGDEEEELSRPLELLALFYQDRMKDPSEVAAESQIEQFFAQDLTFNVSGGPIHFPTVLPFQMALNMFMRENATSFTNTHLMELSDLAPELVCQLVGSMLDRGGLRWSDFPQTSPLGRSEKACEIAVKKGGLSTELQRFLSNLVNKAASSDQLDNLSVAALPGRPASTVSGPLESNIVFYMAYLFLWPYVRLVRDVVAEKEKQLKEYLMIMGLPAMSLLISWFMLYFLASAVVSLLAMWLLNGSMFAASTMGGWYFFLLLMVFITSMLFFGLAVTPIFNQTRTAAACAPLMYFILSAGTLIRSLAGEDAVASSESLALLLTILDAISSPVAFMASLHDILSFDAVTAAQRSITWRTVEIPCTLMAMQSAGYLLLGWYLENVFPRTYGVQQKWYFIFQPSYWFPQRIDPDGESVRLTEMSPDNFDERMDDTLREQSIPDYLQHFNPTLFVQSLSKTYPNGKKALKNVSFGVRKGEIFGLLGPNGAGKSTTLSILCGMLSPSSGDAYVGGSISVANNPQAVRQSLSVCFQQNILYDDLTVWEHLSLVCALKSSLGIKTVSEHAWVTKLQQFGLEEKRDALSKTLSGGQKRKLSLVLALLDSSRVVLLDEPTAGMDMKARLDTWDALKRAVTHRAVILTTHSMQEAQALCENIGIVAEGKLKCCGSSLFLRNQFGVGYKLTIVHHGDDDLDRSDNLGGGRQAWTELLMTTLRKYVPNARIVSDNKWETRVQLNDGDERRFAELFRDLDTMKQNGVIKRYAIAATDLEDVFVKVTEGEDVYYHVKDDVESSGPSVMADPVLAKIDAEKSREKMHWQTSGLDTKLPGWKHSMSQLRALIIKRVKMTSRDKKSLFAQYVWPIGFLAIILAVLQNLISAGGSIEIVTTLPPTARDASLFVSSASEITNSVADIVAHFEQSSQPIVFDKSATTEQAMLDAIARENDTTFFAGVFVSAVNWTSDNTAFSPVMAYSLYYNETVRRSLPVTLQWMSQAYCKTRSKQENSPDIDKCDLVAKKGIFPIDIKIDDAVTADDDGSLLLDPDEAINVVRRIMVAFYLLMTMSSVVSFYISSVVREKEKGLKRLLFQHIESANASFLYWLSNFMFDFTAYFMAITLMLIILAVFSASLTENMLTALMISMVLFGIAVIPFLYLSSLIFSSQSSAQSIMSYVSMFQIMAASIVFALSNIPGLCDKVNTIAYFLQVFPLYTFGITVLNIVTLSWAPMRQKCLNFGGTLDAMNAFALIDVDGKSSVWDWDVTGSNWFALVTSSIVYTLLLLVLDQYQMYPTVVEYKMRRTLRRIRRLLPCWRSYGQGYEEAEQTAVTFEDETDMVRAIRVSKVFNPRKKTSSGGPGNNGADAANGEEAAAVVNESGQVVALNNVSFSVEKRDCVALLGVNGSGKSTMFEILTAGTSPTSGKALIDSCDVTAEPQAASTRYGYCPQGNIFFNDLSVREHLELFYRLRCSRRNGLLSEGAVIDGLMNQLDLFPVEHTAAEHLSGGNKRRLMLALALLSDHTSLLLLDEPSAGVDVVARRLMWRVLHEKRQSQNKTSCLFTTHSMEEAEAVCANAVVLFKGKLVWCGSIPDLKQRVSRGISIGVRLDSTAIWDPEELHFYTEQIRSSLKLKATTATRRAGLERGSIPLPELEEAWELCHGLLHKDADAVTVAASRQHGNAWLQGVLSRLESADSGLPTRSIGSDDPVIPIVEFVQEWLVQEAFVRLETQLFKDGITGRSGEPVVPVDQDTARGTGSNTSGVYETSCTDAFGLADVFGTMEENKSRFKISHYSISELSLERVFEQFT